jgi:hypothetical protein
MVDLVGFPLQAKKLVAPTMPLEDPKLMFSERWKVMTAKELHVLLARQVG